MANERLTIVFPADVDLSPHLAWLAAGVAIDFTTTYPDRPHGFRHGVGTTAGGWTWFVYWTKRRGVVVCLGERLPDV
jgi:hypothetical protein